MSVRFLIGRAGSGKTHRCVEEIAAACAADPLGPPIIFLVPEQGSYEAEKALLESGLIDGYCRAQVLSFTRLAEFVFAQVPAPVRPRLTRAHRDVLTTLLVSREKIRVRGTSAPPPEGLEEALSDFISETKQYAIKIEHLREAASAISRRQPDGEGYPPALLAEKLKNLVRLLEEYQAIVGERFEDPQDTLVNLADLIVKSDLFQGAQIYIDGFIAFTPVEERLLVALAKKCERVTIALLGERASLDEPEPRPAAFGSMRETYTRVMRALADNGIAPIKMELVESHSTGRFAVKSLGLLEKSFLSRSDQSSIDGEGIEFWTAETPRDEARLASEIASRMILERQFEPGEIAILSRDLELFAAPLAEMLTTLKIPFFIDRAEPLEAHPIIAGMQALVRCVLNPAQADYRIALGKSGLLNVSRRDVDRLENHVLQYPRSLREWYGAEPWRARPPRAVPAEDEPRDDAPVAVPPVIDAARRAILAVVKSFADKLQATSKTEGLLSHFVYALCQTVDEIVRARAISDDEEKILDRIGELFSAAAEAAGSEVVEWSVAGEMALASLRQLSLPRIPPMLDQLFVGQVDRSRYPRLKVVILAGLSEGIFPRVASNTTLLNDSERDLLKEFGFVMKPGGKEQFDREGLFAYRAIAAPSHALILLRSRTDGTGGALNPSPYWREVQKRFPALPVREAEEFDAPSRAWRVRELEASILRRIDGTHRTPGKISEIDSQIIPIAANTSPGMERDAVRFAAAFRNEAVLPKDTLARFLNHRLMASASRLESFARCPFQHFVRSLLRPQEMALPQFERTDAGIYAHAVMRNYAKVLREKGVLGSKLSEQELRALFEQAREKPYAHMQSTGLLERASEKLVFGKLDQFVWELSVWLKQTFETLPYWPVAEEVALQDGNVIGLRPYKPAPPGDDWTYEIRGQIDRIDTNRNDPREFVVVDYKLKKVKFNFTTWNGGDNLQLPVYLLALRESDPAHRVVGGLYLDIISDSDEEEITEKSHKYRGVFRSSALRNVFGDITWSRLSPIEGAQGDPDEMPRGWGTAVSDAEFDALLDRTAAMVNEAGRAIISGCIDVAPSRYGTVTACTYCSYRPICMVDFRINRARVRPQLGRAEVLQELRDAK